MTTCLGRPLVGFLFSPKEASTKTASPMTCTYSGVGCCCSSGLHRPPCWYRLKWDASLHSKTGGDSHRHNDICRMKPTPLLQDHWHPGRGPKWHSQDKHACWRSASLPAHLSLIDLFPFRYTHLSLTHFKAVMAKHVWYWYGEQWQYREIMMGVQKEQIYMPPYEI